MFGANKKFASVLAVVVAGSLLVGCTPDKGRERNKLAVSKIADVKKNLVASIGEIDNATAALVAVQSGPDQAKAFANYKSVVADIQKRAKTVASTVADLRARSTEYQAAWQEEVGQLTSEELKSAAATRIEAVKSKFASIDTKLGAANDAYLPYITKLTDLQTYLSNDLSPGAIQAGSKAFQGATEKGETLKSAISAVITELDSVTAAITPLKVTPPAK